MVLEQSTSAGWIELSPSILFFLPKTSLSSNEELFSPDKVNLISTLDSLVKKMNSSLKLFKKVHFHHKCEDISSACVHTIPLERGSALLTLPRHVFTPTSLHLGTSSGPVG